MENLKYQDGKLEILDQRLLPNEAKWLPIGSKEAAFEAIQTLAVRGAPAIGIFAAFSMALFGKDDPAACKAYLDSARPTAVNLSWATARLAKVMENGGDPIAEALAVQAEDIEMCRKISAYGLSLLRDGDGLKILPKQLNGVVVPALQEPGGVLLADPLQRRRAGYKPLRHRAGTDPAGKGKGLQLQGVLRRNPSPAARGAAHQL